ncbi:hypothetical protein [Leclercia sp.]|uniref:hypothetical protein n=1 Tax=Leclercia sp. TaxID=1898428 RepID=UPI0028BF485B|nr:hypothetical protein [Leclercia sp.]
MSTTDERKPDGGLQTWIDVLEATEGEREDAELLMLLIELRRRRENSGQHAMPVSGDHLNTINSDGRFLPCPSCGKPALYWLGNEYTHSCVLPHECPGGHFSAVAVKGKE